MKKYNIRDYASNAFYMYARIGKPDDISCIKEKHKPFRDDIAAVIDTLNYFNNHKKQYISHAIETVYFTLPKKIRNNDISDRVLKLSLQLPAAESTIYSWLQEARCVFAEKRGLYVSVMYSERSE